MDMAGYATLERNRHLFPIKTVDNVLELFKNELTHASQEPDLCILSIVVGAVENSLTCKQGKVQFELDDNCDSACLPILRFDYIETLYKQFNALIKNSVDANLYKKKTYATRELIKRVSDVIWNTLTRSYYKDRAHLQSLYSYLTGNKLDCFGVAFAVVAGCQVLGFKDVHLALSEDHAWVVFGKLLDKSLRINFKPYVLGESQRETAEVTWHGKGNEDKRGQSIGAGVSARSWLYVNNCPVICTRHMQVAAIVSAINPSLNTTSDAYEVALLQQQLFWLLYDLGHLNKYPMALGNLGDLEELAPSDKRPDSAFLFNEAINAAKKYYENHHVYPYTYQGGYFYRHKMYKRAFESWSSAADVIRLYNYSRDDEEIYKEFLEIANDLIPFVMKVESSGHNARSILRDPECFAHLLRFYDGICQWEEGSATPVLHIGWAKPLVNTIGKFDSEVRAQVVIICDSDKNDDMDNCDKFLNNNNYEGCQRVTDVETGDECDGERNDLHPSLEALTAACGEKLLNPKYLLQGGVEPFVGANDCAPTHELLSPAPSTSTPSPSLKIDVDIGQSSKADIEDDLSEIIQKQPTVVLRSEKMKGLKDLLLCEKLNTQAIELQLTAQSQVGSKKKCDSLDVTHRAKRTRRD